MTREEVVDFYESVKDKIRRKSRRSLAKFVTYTNDDYTAEWFHREICKWLDRLERGEIKKLMIFMPPQHGKSELSSRYFPASCLGRNPDYKIAIASYSQDLSSGFCKDIQNILRTPKYKEVFQGVRLNEKRDPDATNESLTDRYFQVVKRKGFVKAVSVESPLTGKPVDIGIIDDPFKDRTEANSEKRRELVWNWYIDVFCSRLHNESKQLMLFTRWHEDDLAGRLLDPDNEFYNEDEAKEWTVLVFPALFEDEKIHPMQEDVNDPREVDEALWESRHTRVKYIRKRATNPTSFNSIDQQRPTNKAGNKIQRDWFVIMKPNELPFDLGSISPNYWVDGAYTKETQNDETGLIAEYFHKESGKLYIFNAVGVRKELYEFLPFFKAYTKANLFKPKSLVYIEPKASGKSMKSMLEKPMFGNFNVLEVSNEAVKLGKWNRVENSEPFLITGKVVLVEGTWNKKFIDQCCSFPNGKHDDMLDNLTYAVDRYFVNPKKGGGVKVQND